ncbi:DegT/DnrJ/EryC1/StrS family aminotransferase [Rubrivirga sp. S365]|uniref:DegT/DnrJ/EryC1/StrS family aminotransferase n=1 Tax=Rubrivirga litoralis TaxID=3075598 RepID=A0ABU3BR82_9BACT|nr:MULTISPECIES: DegT/DnrJ/EryC1/StrS family aminotransferase [unclassified Rubrivirga]MDT0631801.1 DegT/DnrJ/EryC1/StrS family aminotransferase [Rubrivirga sp. F394]MDT7856507.1 DegT/DnrJ/EryC1/StrS family aminotransferase [Rubrivirga sp. S365]
MPAPPRNAPPSMDLQMVDLRAQVAALRPEIDAAIAAVLDRGAFVRGPFVAAFEAELAAYVAGLAEGGAVHALGVGNGTDALQVALMALGVGPGDEVVCPAFTFVATAEAAALLGARPVFADIDPETFNLDPERVADAVTERTKAVVPVHLFGQMADLAAIRDAAGDVPIVEDAAQALGATRDGQAAGTAGAVGTLSFYPSKNLGAFGDGGAVLTTDADLAARVRAIANHGAERKYHHTRVGVNSRLDALQAAILSVQLRHLPAFTDARRAAAALYDAHLDGLDEVVRPARAAGACHVFHQYTVRVPAALRNGLRAHLAARGVPTMVYYPEPLHRMAPYAGGAADLPETDRACAEVLSLPMHPHLTASQVASVAEAVAAFVRTA